MISESKDGMTVAVARTADGESRLVDALVFVLPLLQFVQVKLVGTLLASDVLFVAVFICLVLRHNIRLSSPLARTFVTLCSLWFASQCLTDVMRNSAFADFARGWSKILLTLVNFSVLHAFLYGRSRRILLYGWGLVVGSVLLYFINPYFLAIDHPWKNGMALPTTMAVFLAASHPKCRGVWPALFGVAIGIANILGDARSRGGVCLAVCAYLVSIAAWQRRGCPPVRINFKNIVLASGVAAISVTLIIWVYGYAAEAGMLGERAQEKYQVQASGKLGVLLGGRSDVLGAFAAIYDSPLLGHGSWAKDPLYVLLDLQMMAQLGYENTVDMERELVENEFRIPAHSYLLEAWVEAGVAGALFWGWIAFLTLRVLVRFYPARVGFVPLAGFVAFTLLWDIAFTPYGQQDRLFVPYYVVVLLTCLGTSTVGYLPDRLQGMTPVRPIFQG
jgi:hypothetical protein